MRKPGPSGSKSAQAKTKKVFFKRRKSCRFTADGVEYIDYKDVNLLRQFVPERAKILPRRISGNSARHQRMLATALRRARYLALLPYTTD